MASQTDLGKGILISGIAAGVITAALGYFLMPDTPAGKKTAPRAGDTAYIKDQADECKKQLKNIGLAKDGKQALDHMSAHTVADASPDKNKPRVSPLMQAPELWQVGIAAEKKNVIMDIYDEKATEIHAGVPNVWFINNGLEDALCSSAGLTMDSDGDGFSNQEEFTAGTKPNDAASAPSLADTAYVKLATVGKKSSHAYLHVETMEIEYVEKAESITIKVFAKKDDTSPIKALTKEGVKPGDTFGMTAAEPDRYKLVEIKTGPEGGITVLDTKNPQKGEENGFFVPHGKKNRKKVQDTTVTLTVTAGPKKGETVEVLLGATFTLPGTTDTRCKVVATNDDGSSQILIEGAKNEVTAPKAAK